MRSRDRERGEEIGGRFQNLHPSINDEENVNMRESESAKVEKRNALEVERERKERTIGVATFAILLYIYFPLSFFFLSLLFFVKCFSLKSEETRFRN